MLCITNLVDTFYFCHLKGVKYVLDGVDPVLILTRFYTHKLHMRINKLCPFQFDILKNCWGLAIIKITKSPIWFKWGKIVAMETVDVSKQLNRLFWFLVNQLIDPICKFRSNFKSIGWKLMILCNLWAFDLLTSKIIGF